MAAGGGRWGSFVKDIHHNGHPSDRIRNSSHTQFFSISIFPANEEGTGFQNTKLYETEPNKSLNVYFFTRICLLHFINVKINLWLAPRLENHNM